MKADELRELAEFVAEKYLGKCVFQNHPINNAICRKCHRDCSDDIHRWKDGTTDPAASMEVLRKMLDSGLSLRTGRYVGSKIYAIATRNGTHLTEAPTLELAICLLAKKLYAQRGEGE